MAHARRAPAHRPAAARRPGAARGAAAAARPGRRRAGRGGRPGPHPGQDLGRRATPRPAVPPPPPRRRPPAEPGRRRRRWSVVSVPESPDTPTIDGQSRGRRWSAHGEALGRPAAPACSAEGYRVVVAADGAGSGARLASLAARRRRRPALRRAPATADLTRPGGRIVVAPLHAGLRAARASSWPSCPRPTSPAAAAAHRAPGPARRDGGRVLRGPQARATTSSTTTTASAATAAWCSAPSAASSATTCCSSTRAATSSTCRPTRSTPCATTSAARRPPSTASAAATSPTGQGPGAPGGARGRPGARRALPEAGHTPGLRLLPRHAVAAGDGGRLPLRRDARPAEGHRRREGRHGVASARWTAWCAATSASARPRWPSGPRSRRCRTASRWPCWCPPRCWPSSTSPPSATASPATRCGSRCCPASSRPARPRPSSRASPTGEVDW